MGFSKVTNILKKQGIFCCLDKRKRKCCHCQKRVHNFRFPGNVVTGTPLDTQGMFGGWTVPWGSIALPCTPDTHTHIFKNADIEKASQLFKTLRGHNGPSIERFAKNCCSKSFSIRNHFYKDCFPQT